MAIVRSFILRLARATPILLFINVCIYNGNSKLFVLGKYLKAFQLVSCLKRSQHEDGHTIPCAMSAGMYGYYCS